MEVHLLENLRFFWQCITRFVSLGRFCFIRTSHFVGKLIVEFLLDCTVSREVNLFWGTTLLVLLLCHFIRDLSLVLFRKNTSTVGGTRMLRDGLGRRGR